jgi:hypothetical protein
MIEEDEWTDHALRGGRQYAADLEAAAEVVTSLFDDHFNHVVSPDGCGYIPVDADWQVSADSVEKVGLGYHDGKMAPEVEVLKTRRLCSIATISRAAA